MRKLFIKYNVEVFFTQPSINSLHNWNVNLNFEKKDTNKRYKKRKLKTMIKKAGQVNNCSKVNACISFKLMTYWNYMILKVS